MRAVVLERPGTVEELRIREVPVPVPRLGWVLVRVHAFGLNRSELYQRLGLSEGVSFPIVPGLEAVGEVVAAPAGEFVPGQRVAALMGGMGRAYDGGYAEYTVVPASQIVPFDSDLPWSVLGAVPETLQTAHGSLTIGLDVRAGQTLLIRGGSSSVGMTAAVLARRSGLRVISTTRDPAKEDALRAAGADLVLIDDGRIADRVHRAVPGGVDAAIELVGTPTLQDTLLSTRVHGTVVFTGMLSNRWTVRDFYPIEYIPRGVRLTAYGGDASDLPQHVLQGYLDAVAEGTAAVPIGRVYPFEEIAAAHTAMETNAVAGKIVVTFGD